MRAWLNGRLQLVEETCISPLDRGFTLGDGVFETIPVHHGRPFDLDAHLARLASGLAVLGFGEAVDLAAVRRDIAAYLTTEGITAAVLRLTVTRGVGPRGLTPPAELQPTVLMTWSPPPPRRNTPMSAIIATSTRRNELSPLSRIKALPYVDNLIALREAQAKGAEEALLLNTQGSLAGATIANLFVLRGDRLLTPRLADGALSGTMRALVLALAADAGLESAEQSLGPNDLATADRVLLTNSVRGILELGQIDGRALPSLQLRTIERLRELVARKIAAED